jgi:FkbM family methyltransferase
MYLTRSVLRKLRKFGVGITSSTNLDNLNLNLRILKATEKKLAILSQLYRLDNRVFSKLDLSKLIQKSTSQLGQDCVALVVSEFKRDGFFVEFGATNGIDLSNTYFLETEFNWNGILCEPAKFWKEELVKNRGANLDFDCVWSVTNDKIEFNEVDYKELSTIAEFSNSDMHIKDRGYGKSYIVNSVSLIDLLVRHNAPSVIDYLSIDTEGSEFEILSQFDFSRFSFRFVSCEHNYGSNREKIFQLMISHGYRRILVEHSEFDDWYVNESLVKSQSVI